MVSFRKFYLPKISHYTVDFGEWGKHHFLVVVDAYSKWPEIRHMSSTTAHHTVEVLLDIFSTHAYPRLLVSDNGPQLTADYLESYLRSHHLTSQIITIPSSH